GRGTAAGGTGVGGGGAAPGRAARLGDGRAQPGQPARADDGLRRDAGPRPTPGPRAAPLGRARPRRRRGGGGNARQAAPSDPDRALELAGWVDGARPGPLERRDAAGDLISASRRWGSPTANRGSARSRGRSSRG